MEGEELRARTSRVSPTIADADLLSVLLTSLKQFNRFHHQNIVENGFDAMPCLNDCIVHSNENQHVRSNSAAHSFLLGRRSLHAKELASSILPSSSVQGDTSEV